MRPCQFCSTSHIKTNGSRRGKQQLMSDDLQQSKTKQKKSKGGGIKKDGKTVQVGENDRNWLIFKVQWMGGGKKKQLTTHMRKGKKKRFYTFFKHLKITPNNSVFPVKSSWKQKYRKKFN